VAAVEMKMRRWGEALRQALAYQLGADHAWVAMPLAAASKAYRERWTFEAEGVGLLAVDDRGHVRRPIRAAASPRLLPFVREKLLETLQAHESALQSLSSLQTHGDKGKALVGSESPFAGFLPSDSGLAFPSRSMLSTVSPTE
jgi:hypothetical protein